MLKTIKVTKLFLSGNLKGLTVVDTISRVSNTDAWKVGKEYREVVTRNKVRIIDVVHV